MTWDIPGFSSAYKRPIFAAQIIYHSGAVTGGGKLTVLCVGLKISAGTLVLDQEVRAVFSSEDCDTAAGAASELDLMGIAAMSANPNADVRLAAVTEDGAGVAATVTLTVTGTWSTVGTLKLRINGKTIAVTIAADGVIANAVAAITAAVNAAVRCPFTAASASPVSTLSTVNKSTRMKQLVVYQDLTDAPSGFACAIAGTSTINSLGPVAGVFAGAAGGSGSESIATLLTHINGARYARIANALNDTTNAALVKTFLAAQALPTVQIYDQVVYAVNGTLSNATALAQTTLNDPREQVYAYRNSETMPPVIAAGWAAYRAGVEETQPVPRYDGLSCAAWVAPTTFPSDTWTATEENALLNAGVTPIVTVNATATSSRAICTYCLNGAVQDERCLDIGDPVMADYLVLDLQGLYTGTVQANNLYTADDPPAGAPEAPSNTLTPSMWVREVLRRLEFYRSSGWIEDTFSSAAVKNYLPPSAVFDQASHRIQSNVPFIAARALHQVGVIARQTQNA